MRVSEDTHQPYTVRVRLLDALSPNEMARSSYVRTDTPGAAVLAGMRDCLAHGGRHHVQVYRGHGGYCSPTDLAHECVCSWNMHTDKVTVEGTMSILDAIEEVKAGILPGTRGVGCAAIVMTDGRRYNVVSAYGPLILFDQQTEAQVTAGDVKGDVAEVEWRVDELGGIIG